MQAQNCATFCTSCLTSSTYCAVMRGKGFDGSCLHILFLQPTPWKPINTLVSLKGTNLQPASPRGCSVARVKHTTELLGPGAESGASTKLLVLDLQDVRCGTYAAGMQGDKRLHRQRPCLINAGVTWTYTAKL